MTEKQWILVLSSLDNLVLDNYERKLAAYLEIGWDKKSAKKYLDQKENIMQIATFNTPTVSFSASSRRNRFYAIYDRPDMIMKDDAWQGSVEYLKKLNDLFHIVIISSRPNTQKEKTLEIMRKLGIPVQDVEVYFKEPNAALSTYRSDCINALKSKYPVGFGICLMPNDVVLFDRIGYNNIAFTSLKEKKDFQEIVEAVADDWKQLYNIMCEIKAQAVLQIAPITTQEVTAPKKYQIPPLDVSKIRPIVLLAPNISDLRSSNMPQPAPLSQPAEPPALSAPSKQAEEKKIKTQSMLDQAVFHQLFLGSNKIAGASAEDAVEIPDVEELLSAFMAEIKSKLPFIMQGKVKDFLAYFSSKYNMNFIAIQSSIEANMEGIRDFEGQGFALIYMTLAKFIESLREQAFNMWGKPHIQSLYASLNSTISTDMMKAEDSLLLSSQKEIVLLNNLSFLAWLATVAYPDYGSSSQIAEAVIGEILKLIKKKQI